MVKPEADRAKALARELHLTVGNRRPKGDWYAIGAEFDALHSTGMTQNQVAAQVSANHEHDGGLSPSAAVMLWKRYLSARKEHNLQLSAD